jgi:hypothetical protein
MSFPRGRVLLRACRRSALGIVRFGGLAVATFVIASTTSLFLPLHHPSNAQKLVHALVTSIIAVAATFAMFVAFHLYRYRRTRTADGWRVSGSLGERAMFYLWREEYAPPESFTRFGAMECRVELPNGENFGFPDDQLHGWPPGNW